MSTEHAGTNGSDEHAWEVHEQWMQRCLELAQRGAGAVSPNPMVGAVLVGPEGDVLGEGWHQKYGGPHAEAFAIQQAEAQHGADALREATMYVNLEPCSHHGKTPPCTDLILKKDIPRLVVGAVDPFPAVAGRGIRRLREHGVEVHVGIMEAVCKRLNEAFLHHVETGRPLVTLKVAQTLDGHVATTSGDAKWISSEASREIVHGWRAELDGVLVGSGTARADDPRLTVRHVEGGQPLRIVLDRTGTLPETLNLFTDHHASQTLAVLGEGRDDPAYAEALAGAGGHLLRVSEVNGHLDLRALLRRLGKDGGTGANPVQSLLVEAGPNLSTALLQQDLVDRLFVFIAPKLIGDGTPVLHDLGITSMKQAHAFMSIEWEQVGNDMLMRGYMRAV